MRTESENSLPLEVCTRLLILLTLLLPDTAAENVLIRSTRPIILLYPPLHYYPASLCLHHLSIHNLTLSNPYTPLSVSSENLPHFPSFVPIPSLAADGDKTRVIV